MKLNIKENNMFKLSQIMLVITRPFRFNKKLTILVILIILIHLFMMKKWIYISRSKKKPSAPPKQEIKIADPQIDTQFYLNSYNRYIDKTQSVRNDLNHQNKYNKIIINGSRYIGDINKSNYTIVEYTNVFYKSKFCQNSNFEQLFVKECPYKNCMFSCDKSLVSNADAVLFHAYDLDNLPSEETYELKIRKMLLDRSRQIWILWQDEPFKIPEKFDYYKFNWTLSYPLDSELSDCSYGCTYFKQDFLGRYENFMKESELRKSLQKDFNKRNSIAVWFVSNCDANFRNTFARNLSSLFKVKILGACSEYFNSESNSYQSSWINSFFNRALKLFGFNKEECNRGTKCEKELFDTSKFYLSFESTNCTSYITEKLWKALNSKMIPIVIQPSKLFYKQIAPPFSFIHAEDFDFNVEKLVEHLKKVSNNFQEYLRYHLWRIDFDIVYESKDTEPRRLCELCRKLNLESSIIYYKKISKWFNEKCLI